VLDAGAGNDTLNLNNTWSGSLAGANTLGWQTINVNGGTLFVSDGAITAGTLAVNGGGTLNASNNLVVTGNLALGTGSTLIAGNNTGTNRPVVRGNLTNAGTIDLRSPTGVVAAGDILTIEGNYTTLANNLVLDAVLGASQLSDQVIVRGDFTGSGTVIVNNAGGTGALTTGDGIRLVQVDGSSLGGTLSLAGGTIDAGAFRYGLFAGGIANPNDQDWYLRSRARDVVLPTISAARVAQDLGLTALGTLNERVGEQARISGKDAESGLFTGAWLRAFGKDGPETITSAAFGDTRSNARMGGVQMGVDVLSAVTDSGARTLVGLTGGALWAGTRDFAAGQMAAQLGQSNADGFVIGAYVTHYAPSGFYVDAVVQHDWLDHRISGADGTRADADSRTFIGSLEMGYAFGSLWQIEPQVQVIYTATSFDGFADSAGVANTVSVEDSAIGRAGLRLKRSFAGDETTGAGRFTLYAKGNVWHRLSGGEAVLGVGVSAPGAVAFRESWADVGAGVSVGLGQRAELFADGEVEFGLDQTGTAVAARSGIRLRF
jgi:outer membrane autotransporter protein